jgi:hypothetical protein
MKGTYPRKELRITPARSHYEQGSIRIFVCVCPSTASAMDQRDGVWTGRERAELSHAPRSPPTKAWVLSQVEIHGSCTFRRVAGGLEFVDEVVEACQRPIGECTIRLAYSGLLRGPSKNGATGVACTWYLVENTTTTYHPLFQPTLQHHTLWRWQLLHPLRNGSLTSTRLLPQSQSRLGFPTLPDSRRL